MNINLYSYQGMSNMVHKTLTLVSSSSSAKFLDPYDEEAPVIRYRGKTNFDGITHVGVTESGSNGFERYYFIEDVQYKSPNIALIYCRLDKLYTYRDFIDSLYGYIERTSDSSLGSEYLMDNRPLYPMKNIERVLFKDSHGNTEGFVVPNETEEHQKINGFYVLVTLQSEYGYVTPTPDG